MRSFSPLPVAVVLAALAPATALGATGHWSSPVAVAPGNAELGVSSRAFVTPDGRSLALAFGGSAPVVATGNASGAFGQPVAIYDPPAGTRMVDFDGAVGADGRFAVAWATGDAAHVAIRDPGQAPRGHVDFPGGVVNSVAVTIAPDGAVSVAYRSKDAAAGIYSVLVATAAAGSASFDDPVTVDTGKAGIDDVNIAAGAGGAVGVTYHKLAPSYKTFTVVRSAGAGAFEPPQGVSSSTSFDLEPRIVADADGSFVAAWANDAGAAYATRAPGATAFGPPTVLSGDAAVSLDLAPTPTGGAVAAWAGSGVVKTAVQPAGGSFGEPVGVDNYTGNIPPQPAATVAPDGTVTVLSDHASDGAIQAVDVGGATTTIGYGPAERYSPVSIASSVDRTLALWLNAEGGISAATRSVTAPPSSGPGAKPGAPDKTAPKLTLVDKSRRVTFRAVPSTLKVRVKCSEACVVSGLGSIRAQIGKKQRISPLSPTQGKKAVTGTQTVTFKLGVSTRRLLRDAAARGRGAQAFLTIQAADAASNPARLRVQLSLKPVERR